MTIAESPQPQEKITYAQPENPLPVENITPELCLEHIKKRLQQNGKEEFFLKIKDLAAITQTAYENSGRKLRKNDQDLSVTHPLWIVNKLLTLGITDENALKAALLHDVIEDTDLGHEQIKELTNQETADMVQALTHIKTRNVKDAEGTKMRLIAGSLRTNLLVATIKACDVLHNFHTDSALPENTRRKRASLALSFYEPWVRGLGFESLAGEIGEAAIERLQAQKTKKIREIQETTKKSEIEKLISDLFRSQLESAEDVSGIILSPTPVISAKHPSTYRVYQKTKEEKIDFQDCLPEVNIIADNALQIKILREIFAENNKTITLPNGENDTIHEINIIGAILKINIHYSTSEDEITPADLVLRPNLEPKQKEIARQKYERLKNSLDRVSENGDETLSPVMLEVFEKGNIHFITKDGDFSYAPQGSTLLDAAYMLGKNLGNDATQATIIRESKTFTVVFSPDSPPPLLQEGDQLTFETTDKHLGTTPIDPYRMDMVTTSQALDKIHKQLERQRQWLTQEEKNEVEEQTIKRGIEILETLYQEKRGKRLDIHIAWAFEDGAENKMRKTLIAIGNLPFSRFEKDTPLTEKIDSIPESDDKTSKTKALCKKAVDRLIKIRGNLPTLTIQLPNDQPGILQVLGEILKKSGDSAQIRTTAVNELGNNSGQKPQEVEIVFLPSGPQNVATFMSQAMERLPGTKIKISKKDQ